MSFTTSCISYGEPLLWVAVGIGSVVAWFVGRLVVRKLGADPKIRLLSVPAALLGAAIVYIVPFIVLAIAYPIAYGIGAWACTHFVRPAFLLPLLVGISSAVTAMVSLKRHSRRSRA